jgi:hypothetical protein
VAGVGAAGDVARFDWIGAHADRRISAAEMMIIDFILLLYAKRWRFALIVAPFFLGFL